MQHRVPEENPLRRHLAGLAPKKRASLILAYVDGCTHREIAAQLGVPIGTAKAWIRRSLTALRCDSFSLAEQENTRPAALRYLQPTLTRETHFAADRGSRGERQVLSAALCPDDNITIL